MAARIIWQAGGGVMKKILLALLATGLFLSHAEAQAPFYQRKTITIVVGYLAGDGYDIWARSLVAANSIYNVAKPDGLTLGAVGPSLYLDQITGKQEAQFDWAKFKWIGSSEKTAWIFYMRTDTPYKTMDDLRKAAEPPRCSATGTGTSGHFVPKLLEEAFGAKLKLIVGYKGGSEQDLALERGEVQCRALSIPTFFAREPFGTWRKTNLV